MFGKITGQRLVLAKMYIANYALDQIGRSGGGDVAYIVRNINYEYKLVHSDDLPFFIEDVVSFCDALQNQNVTAIDRGGYWKFKAMSALEAKKELESQLAQLNALPD